MAQTTVDRPFVAVRSPGQADALRKREEEARQEEQRQAEPHITSLLGYIKQQIEDAKTYRQETKVEDAMLQSMRQRAGEYDETTAANIEETGQPDIFMKLTDVKCSAAEAWVHDVLGFEFDRPLWFSPTPIPDIPPDAQGAIVKRTMQQVYQNLLQSGDVPAPEEVYNFAADMRDSVLEQIEDEAKLRAKRMEQVVYDQMVEGGWKNAFQEFVANLTTFKIGVLKGPIVRYRKKFTWGVKGKNYVPVVDKVAQIEWSAPHPLDCYPSRGSVGFDDGDFFERIRFRRQNLSAMRGVRGYNKDAIDAVLTRYGGSGFREMEPTDSERESIENKGTDTSAVSGLIEGWDCWLQVSGRILLEEGVTKGPNGENVDPDAEYDMNAIVIDKYLIYYEFDADPLDRRPYQKESWRPSPGSFWGFSVCEQMEDIQRVCNASVRALVYNESMSSGDQYVYTDISRIPPGEDITESFPGKAHQFQNLAHAGAEKPLYTLRMDSHAQELMGVYDKFARMADEHTGIPAYEHGEVSSPSGAGRTAQGLSMLMSSAARGMKYTIYRIDLNVIEPAMRKLYDWNMQYNPDDSIKGDIQIEPQGVLSRIVREQLTQRRLEYLNNTNNPTDMELMGLTGRAEIHREAAKSLDLSHDPIRPQEDIEAMEMRRRISLAQAAQEQEATASAVA